MAIVASDIKFRRTIKTATSGNSLAQASGVASLGTYMSTTDIPTSLHAMFALMSAADNANMVSQYLSIAIYNAHATLTLTGARAWFSGGDPAGGALVTMAVDPTAASIANSASAQGLTLATITAPGSSVTSLTYSAPSVAGSGILLGDIPAGYCKFLILKRAGNNSIAIDETVNLAITGFTLA